MLLKFGGFNAKTSSNLFLVFEFVLWLDRSCVSLGFSQLPLVQLKSKGSALLPIYPGFPNRQLPEARAHH